MIELIINYQIEYLNLIRVFKDTKDKNTDDYFLLIDKIELLMKRSIKTIFNFLELNKDVAYYGGATYLSKERNELYPMLISNKKLIVAEPILKLSMFLNHSNMFNEKRIMEIIDNAIEQTLTLEKELCDGFVIYINPNDLIKEIKEGIAETAGDLTLQYLNSNLNLKYTTLEELVKANNDLSYVELEARFPKLNDLVATVVSKATDTLEEKIVTNFKSSGTRLDELNKSNCISNVIITLIGLFGQAFELKSISLILNVPIYINRVNVIAYLNFINRIDEDDENRIFESNILFMLHHIIKGYEFIDDNDKIRSHSIDKDFYNKILKSCDKKKLSLSKYEADITKVINEQAFLKDIVKRD